MGSLRYSATEGASSHLLAVECVSEQGKSHCSDIGGTCITERDGYYITNGLCVGLGIIAVVTYVIPTARKLQGEFLLTVLALHRVSYIFRVKRCRSQSGVSIHNQTID